MRIPGRCCAPAMRRTTIGSSSPGRTARLRARIPVQGLETEHPILQNILGPPRLRRLGELVAGRQTPGLRRGRAPQVGEVVGRRERPAIGDPHRPPIRCGGGCVLCQGDADRLPRPGQVDQGLGHRRERDSDRGRIRRKGLRRLYAGRLLFRLTGNREPGFGVFGQSQPIGFEIKPRLFVPEGFGQLLAGR